MKKLIIATIATLLVALTATAQMPNWGKADTLEHYPVGPGIDYCKIYFQGIKSTIWVTTVDLNNPYNKVQQAQSHDQVPDLARWTVQEFAQQNTRPNHKVCAAFNHDFFVYETGTAIGMNISQGEITYTLGGRSLLAIDQNKTAGIFHQKADCRIIAPDGTYVSINQYNGHGLGLNGEAILFNRFNALTLTESGKYILINPLDQWTVNGPNIACKVKQISDSPLQTSDTDYVIFLRGSKLNAFDNKVAVGDTLMISQKMQNSYFGTPLENIMQGFHGYPSIAFEGKLHEGQYNDFENGREYEISSHVMAGHSQDGKKLFIVINEMSSQSAGVNCIDMANFMLSIGCWNVVNFDSGGSAAIVVNNEMLNYPARGSVRPVVDALLAVSVAPDSTSIASYRFHKPSLTTSVATSQQLRLMAFNTFDDVIEWESDGFNFSCVPSSLGYVDTAAVFHASTTSGEGKIIAEKNGISTEISVRLIPVSKNIFISPKQVYIDNTRTYPVKMWYATGTTNLPVTPSAFIWSVQDSSICTVSNDGILRGIKSGTTKIIASLDNITDSLTVTVEIPEHATILWDDFNNATDRWKLNTSSSAWDTHFNTDINGKTSIQLNYSSARQPFIKISLDSAFFGLPDSITFRFNPLELPISKATWSVYTQNERKNLEFTDIQPNSDNTFTIRTADLGGIEQFPLRNNYITLYINSSETTKGEDYTINLDGIYLHYPYIETSTTSPTANSQLTIYPNPAHDIITVYGDIATPDGKLQLYTTSGQLIKQTTGTQMNISNQQPGTYIIRYTTPTNTQTTTLIIK